MRGLLPGAGGTQADRLAEQWTADEMEQPEHQAERTRRVLDDIFSTDDSVVRTSLLHSAIWRRSAQTLLLTVTGSHAVREHHGALGHPQRPVRGRAASQNGGVAWRDRPGRGQGGAETVRGGSLRRGGPDDVACIHHIYIPHMFF